MFIKSTEFFDLKSLFYYSMGKFLPFNQLDFREKKKKKKKKKNPHPK